MMPVSLKRRVLSTEVFAGSTDLQSPLTPKHRVVYRGLQHRTTPILPRI